MKKILLFPLLFTGALIWQGCLGTASTTQNQLRQAVNAEVEKINTNTQEFIQENLGATPETVLDKKYSQLVENVGPKDIFTYSANGTPGYPVAFYLSEQLNVDYPKLAFVQYQSGTMGLQGLLEAMDQTAPGVAEMLALMRKNHRMTEASYYQENMPAGLTDQEQAAFIVQTIYDTETIFYPGTPDLTNAQAELVDQLVQLSGLPKIQLSVLADQWKIYSAFEIMPDSLEYKVEAQRLIDEVY